MFRHLLKTEIVVDGRIQGGHAVQSGLLAHVAACDSFKFRALCLAAAALDVPVLPELRDRDAHLAKERSSGTSNEVYGKISPDGAGKGLESAYFFLFNYHKHTLITSCI